MRGMKKEKLSHAEENARAWMETISEQVAALEMDWERLEELRDTDPADLDEDERVELSELVNTAGEFEDRENVEDRIREEPLSVEVRSGWYSPGGDSFPEEFMILLSTGGPALRIIGELDENLQPIRCRLEHQDWGTPWTGWRDADRDVLETWARQFYYGD